MLNTILIFIFCFFQDSIIHDIVINANPDYPPYSLLGLNKVWGESLNLKITNFIHSSVVNIPINDILSYFSSKNVEFSDNVPNLNVTIIWKSGKVLVVIFIIIIIISYLNIVLTPLLVIRQSAFFICAALYIFNTPCQNVL